MRSEVLAPEEPQMALVDDLCSALSVHTTLERNWWRQLLVFICLWGHFSSPRFCALYPLDAHISMTYLQSHCSLPHYGPQTDELVFYVLWDLGCKWDSKICPHYSSFPLLGSSVVSWPHFNTSCWLGGCLFLLQLSGLPLCTPAEF